jgi:predicted CopG family antitoxin
MVLYKEKLSHKSVSEKVQKEIDQYEKTLDVLNITIWRKQAEIEVWCVEEQLTTDGTLQYK